MSDFKVTIREIKEVKPHPNADRLELIIVDGWQVVGQKDKFIAGDLVVFIPPDAVLPFSLHNFLGITKYCAELPKNNDGTRPDERRVRAARLRGESSYGTLMTSDSYFEYLKQHRESPFWDKRFTEMESGEDVTEYLGITKWEPPIKCNQGDAEREHNAFDRYSKIEHWQNYPHVLQDGENIVITEKIHGCLKNDSLIEMEDGSEKAIENIKIGDKVKTYDCDKGIFTSESVIAVVMQDKTDKLDWFKLEFDNGKSLVCTEDHPILTTDGWVLARNLTEKHIIL